MPNTNQGEIGASTFPGGCCDEREVPTASGRVGVGIRVSRGVLQPLLPDGAPLLPGLAGDGKPAAATAPMLSSLSGRMSSFANCWTARRSNGRCSPCAAAGRRGRLPATSGLSATGREAQAQTCGSSRAASSRATRRKCCRRGARIAIRAGAVATGLRFALRSSIDGRDRDAAGAVADRCSTAGHALASGHAPSAV